MIRIKNLKNILNKVSIINFTKSYSSKRIRNLEENPYESLPSYFRDKIIYSSCLEDSIPKIGYKNNRIQFNKAENKRKKLKNDLSSSVQPFPTVLKFLNETNNLDINVNKIIQIPDTTEEPVSVFNCVEPSKINIPKKWMQDYEYFDEDEECVDSQYGTPDPSVPASKTPCNGCGAHLHCADPGLPGYIPGEIFKGRTNNELKQIVCQRCHFLKTYNIALDVSVNAETYIETISSIKNEYALAILIVDLLDFPGSIWPGIQDILGDKRPIFIVGNKVDLLPKDCKGYLDHIQLCLKHEIINAGLKEMNIKAINLISAKTGYGIEELITKLHNVWKYKGDVYLVGCTNVGKSSLFNSLLRSDYCKVQAFDLVKKATTCPWPGTTLQMLKFPILRPSDIRVFRRFERLFSERAKKAAEAKLQKDQLRRTRDTKYATLFGHIGNTFKDEEEDSFSAVKGTKPILTLNERAKEYVNSKWCYDTPGVVQPDQIHCLLTTEELLLLNPETMITPRVFKMKPKLSMFLAGLGRLDFLSSDTDYIRITVYASFDLPIVITNTKDADEVYKEFLGTDILGIPCGDEARLSRWPKLECGDTINVVGSEENGSTCDIILSSAGWIGISVPLNQKCTFKAWTPEKRGIYVRRPSLIQYGEKLRSSKIRGSLAYKIGKPFILQ